MNLLVLRQLLDKYYEGKSSSEEETQLIAMLRKPDLPEEFEADRNMFSLLKEDISIPEPDAGFENRIMSAIDKSQGRRQFLSQKRNIYSMISVAASLLIAVSSYFFINANRPSDTFDDPVLAYNETMRVLYGVSQNLNIGSSTIEELAVFDVARSNLRKLSIPQRVIANEMSSLKYVEKGFSILYPGKE